MMGAKSLQACKFSRTKTVTRTRYNIYQPFLEKKQLKRIMRNELVHQLRRFQYVLTGIFLPKKLQIETCIAMVELVAYNHNENQC
jgi:hypothetical protein